MRIGSISRSGNLLLLEAWARVACFLWCDSGEGDWVRYGVVVTLWPGPDLPTNMQVAELWVSFAVCHVLAVWLFGSVCLDSTLCMGGL